MSISSLVKNLFSGSVLVFGLATSSDSSAQPPAVTDIEGRKPEMRYGEPFGLEIISGFETFFPTELGSGGKLSANVFTIASTLDARINQKLSISLGARYIFTDFDFRGKSALGELSPWDKTNNLGLSVRANYQLSDRWALTGLGLIRSAGENGAQFAKTITGGGGFGVTYALPGKLIAGLGATVISRLEDSVLPLPLLFVDWQIYDNLKFSTLITGARTQLGPRVGLIYDLKSNLKVALVGSYEFRRFRLDGDGVAPDGIGDIQGLPVWTRFSYSVAEWMRFDVFGGFLFAGRVELEDSNGDRIEKENLDPAPFLGGGIFVNF